MWLVFAFDFGAAALVEAAGYFFKLKLNNNLVAGARSLILMAAIWFAVEASRKTVTPHATPSRSGIELGYLRPTGQLKTALARGISALDRHRLLLADGDKFGVPRWGFLSSGELTRFAVHEYYDSWALRDS